MSTRTKTFLLFLILLISFSWLLYYIDSSIRPQSHPVVPISPTPTISNNQHVLGVQSKTIGCNSKDSLPDSACTPGAVFPNVTKEQICTPGYSSSVRHVPDKIKKEVYWEYGISSHQPGEYEVDHLISLELGGSNDISNLWPQPCNITNGCHQKDEVENYLHNQVCSGQIDLSTAQQIIATNWFTIYQKLHP